MKVRVDPAMPSLSEEEQAEIEALAEPADADPEVFKREMLGAKEFVLSPQVKEFLDREGISPDELVAVLLRKAKAAN
jgi:hypothetical protein